MITLTSRRRRAYRRAHSLRVLALIAALLLGLLAHLAIAPPDVHRSGPALAAPGSARVEIAPVFGGQPLAIHMTVKPVRAAALGPAVNRFSGYDLTQATICCGGGWASAPWVSATSYYNASMNSRTNLAHDTSASISSYYTLQVGVGQVVGLMCWTQRHTGTYWEKTDSRHTVNGVSNLYIAYIADAFITVSRADLFAYVPRCSSTASAGLERLIVRALARTAP